MFTVLLTLSPILTFSPKCFNGPASAGVPDFQNAISVGTQMILQLTIQTSSLFARLDQQMMRKNFGKASGNSLIQGVLCQYSVVFFSVRSLQRVFWLAIARSKQSVICIACLNIAMITYSEFYFSVIFSTACTIFWCVFNIAFLQFSVLYYSVFFNSVREIQRALCLAASLFLLRLPLRYLGKISPYFAVLSS